MTPEEIIALITALQPLLMKLIEAAEQLFQGQQQGPQKKAYVMASIREDANVPEAVAPAVGHYVDMLVAVKRASGTYGHTVA